MAPPTCDAWARSARLRALTNSAPRPAAFFAPYIFCHNHSTTADEVTACFAQTVDAILHKLRLVDDAILLFIKPPRRPFHGGFSKRINLIRSILVY